MTKEEVIKKYHISDKKAVQMAKKMGFTKVKGKWIFPEDFVPLYIPDGRKYKVINNSPLLPYMYLMDAISLLYCVENNYNGVIDKQVRETVVRELKKAGLIKLKEGANKKSLNYRDYIVSLSAGDWFDKPIRERKEYLIKLVNAASAGITYGTVSALS